MKNCFCLYRLCAFMLSAAAVSNLTPPLAHAAGTDTESHCPPLQLAGGSLRFTTKALVIETTAGAGKSKLSKSISLDEVSPASCVSLKAVDGHPGLAEVVLWSGEQGTSTSVSEKKFGVVNIKKGTWAAPLFPLERKIEGSDGAESTPLGEATWAYEGNQVVLNLKKLETGAVSTKKLE